MCKDIFIFFNKVYIISKKDKKGHYHSCMSKKESAKRSNPIAKTAPSQMLSASATPMLSLSKSMLSPPKYTKKNLRNLLHLRKSARREATTSRRSQRRSLREDFVGGRAASAVRQKEI